MFIPFAPVRLPISPVVAFSFGVLCFLFLISATPDLYAQKQERVEILQAAELSLTQFKGKQARRLKGNVQLRKGNFLLNCDSAFFYVQGEVVDAYGHVVIVQGDSLRITSDSLWYDGQAQRARLMGNVVMDRGEATLKTPQLWLNTQEEKAWYLQGGELLTSESRIISQRGLYVQSSEMIYFGKDVELTTTGNLRINSDTLAIHIPTRNTYFFGPAVITQPNQTIHCRDGFYHAGEQRAVFGKDTRIYNGSATIFSDSLWYDEKNRSGESFAYFEYSDTVMQARLSGLKAWFTEMGNQVIATDSAIMAYQMGNDSLYMSGDTLISKYDSLLAADVLIAYTSVRIFKTDLQGVCDSLYFSFHDSIIRMYHRPVLWNENNQLSGDTIWVQLREQQVDEVTMKPNGFIVNQVHPLLYNQIAGRSIQGFFESGKLDRLWAEGNAESLYFADDDLGRFIGLNQAKSSHIWIYMKDQQVDHIHFVNQPEAMFIPMKTIGIEQKRLNGFLWRISERPGNKDSVWKPAITETRPADSTTSNFSSDPVKEEPVWVDYQDD